MQMKTFRSCSMFALAVLVAGILETTASAQNLAWTVHGAKTSLGTASVSDVQKVNYFSNANTSGAPDGKVRISNPGSPTGNLCAQIYVFDPSQELTECCACLVTPNGLRKLSVNADLTANPLTGVALTDGEVSIISGYTNNNVCSPLNDIVSPTIRAWGTHVDDSFLITETEYSDRTLGLWNDNLLVACKAISLDGSGHGTCTCGTGD
jgi:hypothetical protein